MRKLFSKMDIPLFIMVVLFVLFGLVMIYSASNITAVVRYGYQPYHFFIRQAIFVIVSFLIGFLIVLRFPTRNYGALAWPLVFLLIGSLALLFVKGKIAGGAQSWFDLKYFKVQPSEFAKSILVIFMAIYYNRLNLKKVKNIAVGNYNNSEVEVDLNSYVSMNLWGLKPSVFKMLEDYFISFLKNLDKDDIKSECLIPVAIDKLIKDGAFVITEVNDILNNNV